MPLEGAVSFAHPAEVVALSVIQWRKWRHDGEESVVRADVLPACLAVLPCKRRGALTPA